MDQRVMLLHCMVALIVWFQKISIPPPRRELEIPRGWGGSKTQEIPEGRGVRRSILFPDALRFNTNSSIDLGVQKSFLTS